jgi:hypothetical protein
MAHEDRAQSLMIYSKECINSGRISEAKKAIDEAILLLPCIDQQNIDDELLRLIKVGL